MDNVINYIFEVYDDMKKKSMWEYFKGIGKTRRSQSTFYEIENVKLNYAILMPNTNDVLENRHSFGINFRF